MALSGSPDRDHSPAEAVVVLAGFLGVFALLCGPWLEKSAWTVPEPGRTNHADTQLVVWILWWVSWALRHVPSALFNAPINYPLPNQLTGSDHFLSGQILFTPLYAILGNPIQATSVTLWLVTFPLTAWAMHRLLTKLGMSRWTCLAGALLYALNSYQVPVDIHRLQAPLLFFPLVTSAIVSLRKSPTWQQTVILAIALTTGLLLSFYLAAMLLVVSTIVIVVTHLLDAPRQGRYLTRSLIALGASTAILGFFSVPYFGRGEVWATTDGSIDPAAIPRAIGHVLRSNPQILFGGWLPISLAILGLGSAWNPRTRGITIAATLIVVAGVALATGGLALLADIPAPDFARQLVSLPARFFRVSSRLVGMVIFGETVLASLAIDGLEHRWPRAARAGVVALVLFLVATQGIPLRETSLGRMIGRRVETLSYAEVGRIANEHGSGPLLELPIRRSGDNWQADHMMGSMWHGQPLITGRTGYNPPQNEKVVELVNQLPDSAALEQLVSTTGVRWVLVRPRPGFDARRRSRLVWGLAASNLVEERFAVGSWMLFRLRPPPG